MRTSTLAALLLVPTILPAAQPALPEGWRFATPDELSDDSEYRNASPTQFVRAVADFNGDDIPDWAYLVKSTRFSGEGLVLSLSCGPGCSRWITLDSINWGPDYPSVGLSMGIDIIPPGTYEYICVEAQNDCVPPEREGRGRPTITIHNPGLTYFKLESASSFFYWDPDRAIFIRVWSSD